MPFKTFRPLDAKAQICVHLRDLCALIKRDPDGLSGHRPFFSLQKLEAIFSSLVLAHRRCAHSFSASQLGELVLKEDRH